MFSITRFVHALPTGATIATGRRTFCPGHHSHTVISTTLPRRDGSLARGFQSSMTCVSSVEVSRTEVMS